MAWTVPRTWVPGELVTANMMNTHVRDNMNYLKTAAGINVTTQAGAAYTAVRDDFVLASNVAGVITLTASGTVGAGARIWVKNTGAGTITVQRSGADTIDGATSFTLAPNDAAGFVADGGTAWKVF